MNDTVKIERPICCRRHEDVGGRVKLDTLGNAVKVKTRVHDHPDDMVHPEDLKTDSSQTVCPGK